MFSFSCLSLSSHGFYWWESLPCSYWGTQVPSTLWFYPSLSPSVLTIQPAHGKKEKKKWFLRGFYEPGLEAAPTIFLTCHWTELRHMTTRSCKGNIVQLCPKDDVRAQIGANLCHRFLADFIQNHITRIKPFLLLRKSLHSKKWLTKQYTHFIFILQ